MESNLQLFLLVFLGLFGTLFGSFSSVLIHRWHSKTAGILTGRSECPECKHTLGAEELIPIISYFLQKGRCKHCKVPISHVYPLLEVFMGIWFVSIGYAILQFEIPLFSAASFLLILYAFITALYMVYDLKYMEIPDQALIPGIYISLFSLLGLYFFPELTHTLYPHIGSSASTGTIITNAFLGAWIIYTFFYIQILIPGGIYALERKNYSLLGEVIVSYFTFPFYILTGGYFEKEKSSRVQEEEIPTWIGGGDLRIALFIGLTLGTLHTFSTLAIAYIFGSIFGIGYIIYTKNRKAHIPFGPFLGVGWMLSLMFYGEIEKLLNYINF